MKIDFIMQITPENLHRIKNKPLREKNKRKKYFHLFGDIVIALSVMSMVSNVFTKPYTRSGN